MRTRRLRLNWSLTWPGQDKPNDFVCRTDDGHKVGRVYEDREPGTNKQRWRAFLYGSGSVGFIAEKYEACEALERAWFDAQERKKR